MDVAEEGNAQIAKRQAIQAIMRDTSLTPQEKQRRVQKCMANDGPNQASEKSSAPDASQYGIVSEENESESVAESTAALAPSRSDSAPPLDAASTGTSTNTPNVFVPSRQALVAQVMRDPSLTNQQKQQKIREILNSGSDDKANGPDVVRVDSQDSDKTTDAVQQSMQDEMSVEPSSIPSTSSSRQVMIADVMRNPNLTNQEKQEKIREIMQGGESTSAPVDTLKSSSNGQASASGAGETSATSNAKPSAVGATASTGPDPAARKGARASRTVTPQAYANLQREAQIQEVDQPYVGGGETHVTSGSRPSIGASAGIGPDPAIRKGARESRTVTPQTYADLQREAQNQEGGAGETAVPSAPRPSAVGASVSTGPDPAIRKGARASRTVTPQAYPDLQPQAQNQEVDQPQVGAGETHVTSASRPSASGASASTGPNPAARKGARATSAVTPQAYINLQREAQNREVDQPQVGASPSRGRDPASRKGGVSSSTSQFGISHSSEIATFEHEEATPMSIGAVSSTGVDPAARKGPRMSTTVQSSSIGDSWSRAEEPASIAPSSVGAVASGGSDPATRKGGRGTVQGPSSLASHMGSDASAGLGGSQSTGTVASSSRYEDPAVRKTARSSRPTRASRTVNTTAAASSSEPVATVTTASPGCSDLQTSNTPTSTTPTPQSHDLAQSAMQTSAGSPVIRSGPTEEIETTNRDFALQNYEESRPLTASHEPEMYAGANLSGYALEGIAGADAGGIQAYVAGEDRPGVVTATEVVNEEAIEEAENLKQRRTVRIFVAIGCALLIAVIISIAVVLSGGSDSPINVPRSPTAMPSAFPTIQPSAPPTGATFAELLDTLEPLYPNIQAFEDAFGGGNTPQYRAAEWAANAGSLGLPGNDPRMISRFALATFYFATNGDDWVECGVASTRCDRSREWLTAENECNWLAVGCANPDAGDYSVIELFFPPIFADGRVGNNIDGELPFELSLLSSLEVIVLSRQALKGTIPETWSSMSALRTLIIAENQLTGSFPVFLFAPSMRLRILFINDNQLTGPLPTFSSSVLEELRIRGNMLNGRIPSSFGGLQSLVELQADGNFLTGGIPEEIYSLTSLRQLRLGANPLGGSMTSSIANLRGLQVLNLTNTQMTGTLTSGLFNLTNLETVDLSNNDFSGTLPAGFGHLVNATGINLHNNSFFGTIPETFHSLQFLRTLRLHDNGLTGFVSELICNRTGEGFFDIGLLTADCLGEVECDCCNECY